MEIVNIKCKKNKKINRTEKRFHSMDRKHKDR